MVFLEGGPTLEQEMLEVPTLELSDSDLDEYDSDEFSEDNSDSDYQSESGSSEDERETGARPIWREDEIIKDEECSESGELSETYDSDDSGATTSEVCLSSDDEDNDDNGCEMYTDRTVHTRTIPLS